MISEYLARYISDKVTVHAYEQLYDSLFGPLRQSTRYVLELGIAGGASLRAWRDYFPKAEIWGVDNSPAACLAVADEQRIHTLLCDSGSPGVVVPAQMGGWEWDIVIDDAGHDVKDQALACFWLYTYLKPGGLYVIEDIQHHGYLRHFTCFQNAEILDLRHVKGRQDDLVVVIKKPGGVHAD
jgi:hypothetical protein